jgi:rSAM/selenodomain-associated transferase 2
MSWIHRISIIVPVLNETRRIGDQLERLTALDGIAEVIVVDGGSSDGTLEKATGFPGVRLLSSARGRACQMNAGARAASGDVLLFLHADVVLPVSTAHWVERALLDESVVAGAFETWTVSDEGARWLSPLLHLADLRSRVTNLPYGDQAIFVRAATFRQLDGFPDLPLMEDLAFSRRLRRAGRIARVPARVQVSGRRFQARPIHYTLIVNLFPLLYRLGVSPNRLADWYPAER